jgi:hypothetical protein
VPNCVKEKAKKSKNGFAPVFVIITGILVVKGYQKQLCVFTKSLASSALTTTANILFDNVFAANITTKNATFRRGCRTEECAKRSDRVFHYALSYLPLINPSCATFLPLGFTVFGSFSKELCSLFDRFTTIIFEREQDSFCRSLCSIRKYLKVILLYIY